MYYSLPFCSTGPVDDLSHRWDGLGEVLEGNDLISSGFDFQFLRPVHDHAKICSLTLTGETAATLQYAVRNHYWYQFYLDDLPIWGMVGELASSDADDGAAARVGERRPLRTTALLARGGCRQRRRFGSASGPRHPHGVAAGRAVQLQRWPRLVARETRRRLHACCLSDDRSYAERVDAQHHRGACRRRVLEEHAALADETRAVRGGPESEVKRRHADVLAVLCSTRSSP